MQPTDLTIEILKGIRDEVRNTNARIDSLRDEVNGLRRDTNTGFSETNARLDRFERRQTETEVRLSTELSRSWTPCTSYVTCLRRIVLCAARSAITSAGSLPSECDRTA